MNLDMLIGRLRSHVFHDDQWPADSSTVTCNIVVDLAGTPQLAELSNKSGRRQSNTNDETINVNYEGGQSVDLHTRGHHNV